MKIQFNKFTKLNTNLHSTNLISCTRFSNQNYSKTYFNKPIIRRLIKQNNQSNYKQFSKTDPLVKDFLPTMHVLIYNYFYNQILFSPIIYYFTISYIIFRDNQLNFEEFNQKIAKSFINSNLLNEASYQVYSTKNIDNLNIHYQGILRSNYIYYTHYNNDNKLKENLKNNTISRIFSLYRNNYQFNKLPNKKKRYHENIVKIVEYYYYNIIKYYPYSELNQWNDYYIELIDFGYDSIKKNLFDFINRLGYANPFTYAYISFYSTLTKNENEKTDYYIYKIINNLQNKLKFDLSNSLEGIDLLMDVYLKCKYFDHSFIKHPIISKSYKENLFTFSFLRKSNDDHYIYPVIVEKFTTFKYSKKFTSDYVCFLTLNMYLNQTYHSYMSSQWYLIKDLNMIMLLNNYKPADLQIPALIDYLKSHHLNYYHANPDISNVHHIQIFKKLDYLNAQIGFLRRLKSIFTYKKRRYYKRIILKSYRLSKKKKIYAKIKHKPLNYNIKIPDESIILKKFIKPGLQIDKLDILFKFPTTYMEFNKKYNILTASIYFHQNSSTNKNLIPRYHRTSKNVNNVCSAVEKITEEGRSIFKETGDKKFIKKMLKETSLHLKMNRKSMNIHSNDFKYLNSNSVYDYKRKLKWSLFFLTIFNLTEKAYYISYNISTLEFFICINLAVFASFKQEKYNEQFDNYAAIAMLLYISYNNIRILEIKDLYEFYLSLEGDEKLNSFSIKSKNHQSISNRLEKLKETKINSCYKNKIFKENVKTYLRLGTAISRCTNNKVRAKYLLNSFFEFSINFKLRNFKHQFHRIIVLKTLKKYIKNTNYSKRTLVKEMTKTFDLELAELKKILYKSK